MKQIKGEPWPSGETLAGYRDGIQMEEPERVIHRGSGDSSALSIFFLSVFFFFITRVKLPKSTASVGHPVSVMGASSEQSCLSPHTLAQTARLSPPFHIQPVGKLSPTFGHDFYWSHGWLWKRPHLMWCEYHLVFFFVCLFYLSYSATVNISSKTQLASHGGILPTSVKPPPAPRSFISLLIFHLGVAGEIKGNGKGASTEGRKMPAKWMLADRWHTAC